MRVKVTIRERQVPAPIAETTMNKGIQTIYESMRAKLNKIFLGRKPFPHAALSEQRDKAWERANVM
ncbi:hypothetical protein [Bacteroides faecium]|uniref:Uncharacterized protein n=1 Tax=Bacteroides faecium TaxID=2715212 RepID=A0A6H0KHA2_9BACE|nr:hypothetical protein [Bacteroides faecium]QIU92629.1 hypothetical protein BacF7301_01930 [Bacteroides faecium]